MADELARLRQAPADLLHVAGVVTAVEGDVSVLEPDGRRHNVAVGSPIVAGTTLQVGENAKLSAIAISGDQMTLAKVAQMRSKDHQQNCDTVRCEAPLELFVGTMRVLRGWAEHVANKLGFEQPQVITPTAVVGVRGTDHEVTVVKAGDPRGEAGTYDRVYSGATTLSNKLGSVDIAVGQIGFSSESSSAPRILKDIPSFLQN